ARVGVEIDAEHGGEHRRRQVLGVVAGVLVGLPEAVVLREVAVLRAVLGDRHADRGGHQTMRLVGGVLAPHDVEALPRLEHLLTPGLEDRLAWGGKIDDTRTRLNCAMPAARSAISKLESFSRCLPTPAVRKIFLATNAGLLILVGSSERLT